MAKPKLKIGLVLDDTLDTPDGVQQYVINLGQWLHAQGHDVHYLVGETKRTDIAKVHSLSRNVKVRFNANRMSMPLPASKAKLRAFLLEEQFDVLHVQTPYSPFMAGRLIRVVPDSTAVVGTFHILPNSRVVRRANSLLAKLNLRSARRFDEIMAVSEPAKQFAEKVYGFDGSVVPNPVNLTQFEGVHSKTKTTNIVFLGRLVERKGAQHLIKAVAYLREHDLVASPFRVVIGGKGVLLSELKASVTKNNLQEIVSFSGFVAETDKAQFLAEADIAVFPSTGGESFGISLLEALAVTRGVVLAGDNPGYASVMAPLGDRLFDPKNTTAFANTLARWIDNPTPRQMAAEAQKTYVQQFDIGVVGTQVEQVYARALQKRHTS